MKYRYLALNVTDMADPSKVFPVGLLINQPNIQKMGIFLSKSNILDNYLILKVSEKQGGTYSLDEQFEALKKLLLSKSVRTKEYSVKKEKWLLKQLFPL